MHSSNPAERERAQRSAAKMPVAERVARRHVTAMGVRPGTLVFKLVIAALGFAFFGFFGGWMFLIGIGAVRYSGLPAGATESLLGVCFMVIAGLSVLWAVSLEHEMRGLPSGPAASRRRYAPGSTGTAGLLVAAAGLIPLLIAVGLFHAAGKSGYTQAHGVRVRAEVLAVDNDGTGRSTISVRLPRPAGGQREAVVHVPHRVSAADFRPLDVLVDPRAPGYAELPGTPDTTYRSLIGPGLGALFFFLLGGFLIGFSVRNLLRRHSWHAEQAVGPP